MAVVLFVGGAACVAGGLSLGGELRWMLGLYGILLAALALFVLALSATVRMTLHLIGGIRRPRRDQGKSKLVRCARCGRPVEVAGWMGYPRFRHPNELCGRCGGWGEQADRNLARQEWKQRMLEELDRERSG